jgi:hypothetical protein
MVVKQPQFTRGKEPTLLCNHVVLVKFHLDDSMAGMKKTLWFSVALAEAVIARLLSLYPVTNAPRIGFTRIEVLRPNAAYFAGMLFGDLIRLMPVALLIWHMVWIFRTRLFQAVG